MSSKQFKHIQKIRQTYRDDSELSKANQINLIKIIAEDLNNSDAHFIFELIQNAEDNMYVEPSPYISFWLTKSDPTYTDGSEGALIIENNEVGFNRNDVAAVCAAAQSPKRKKHEHIGEKGIGFKSVFRVTENPHIFSNGYHFCLPKSDEETGLGYIVPQWVDIPPSGLDPTKTHIILPLNRAEFGYDEIEDMLQDIEPETILFLSKLQEIRIKTDTGADLTILKNDSTKPKVEILIEGKKQGQSFSVVNDFLLCRQTFHKPAHIRQERREDIEEREVSIAFQLDENSKELGKIYAYLPVKTVDFPFLINADFILTSSRQDIHQDNPWNHWLIECLADLIAKKLLPLLKEQDLLSINFLEALASKLNNLAEDNSDLFHPVFSRLRETFMNEELLPANDGTFVSAQNAKLDDSEGLIELLKPNQLSLLFKRSNVTKWLVPDITARRAQNLWKYLRMELKIDKVDPEMFARRIDKSFLEQQDDDWLIDFYKFLSVGKRPPRSLWTSASGILRSKPILRLQDNSLVKPDEPNVYLSKGTDSAITTRLIKIEISRNEDAHKFLRELDVPEWDIISEVIEHILPKYRDNPSLISSAESNRDFSKIVNAYKTDSQKKKDQLREKLLGSVYIV